MRKLLFALVLCLLPTIAHAQNTTCSDRQQSDSSNACANTRFAHGAAAKFAPGGANGSVQYNNGGVFGGINPLDVPRGGTGQQTFTPNLPLVGNGTGAIGQGTRSGNTTVFGTISGTLASGNCASFDFSGNIIDSGAPCSSGSSFYNTVADAKAASATETIIRTNGNLSPNDFGGATYVQVTSNPSEPCSFQLTNGNWAKLYVVTATPQMCKLSTDAGDDALMFNRFFSYVSSNKATGIVPPGLYTLQTQVSITVPSDRRMSVSAYGAKFNTVGAIYAFYVTGGGYSGGATLSGFAIDQSNNTTALGGWHLSQAGNVYIVDTDIAAGGTVGNYEGIYIDGSTPGGSNGDYWNQIIRPQIYSYSASKIPFGIYLLGYANATQIIGGQFGTISYPIYIDSIPPSGPNTAYVANGVVISQNAFETCDTGITFRGILGNADTRPLGLRIVNNRAENIAQYFLNYLNVNQNSDTPTYMSGNMLLGVNNYINNPNYVQITALDQPTSLSGSATISGTSINITFPIAQPSTHYYVYVSGEVNSGLWISNRTITGFTINAATSVSGNVFWQVVREK